MKLHYYLIKCETNLMFIHQPPLPKYRVNLKHSLSLATYTSCAGSVHAKNVHNIQCATNLIFIHQPPLVLKMYEIITPVKFEEIYLNLTQSNTYFYCLPLQVKRSSRAVRTHPEACGPFVNSYELRGAMTDPSLGKGDPRIRLVAIAEL